jgi:hypothetical protein
VSSEEWKAQNAEFLKEHPMPVEEEAAEEYADVVQVSRAADS